MRLTKEEFEAISKELCEVADKVPVDWGAKQNHLYDSELRDYCNIFEIRSLSELDKYLSLSPFDEHRKQYHRCRWYRTACSWCDEYLFYCNDGVTPNPNEKAKEWDLQLVME